jgi:hypothetical protein
MEIVALATAPLAAILVAAALRTDFAQAATPALFFLMVAGVALAYVGAAEGQPLCLIAASAGAGLAAAGLVATVLTIDSRLAAKGTANAGPAALRPSLTMGRGRRWQDFEDRFQAHVESFDTTVEAPVGAVGRDAGRFAEALFPLEREGRAALLIFLRRDEGGRLLDAAAFDPEDYA